MVSPASGTLIVLPTPIELLEFLISLLDSVIQLVGPQTRGTDSRLNDQLSCQLRPRPLSCTPFALTTPFNLLNLSYTM